MDFVGEMEEKQDEPLYHSFSREGWPGELSEKDSVAMDDTNSPEEFWQAIPRNKRYLPCHYFDQIGGSSTGA